MSDIWLVYSTFTTRDEAVSAARDLLNNRLIACATIHDGATSLYRWEGKLQQEAEAVLMAKTHKAKVEMAVDALKRLHSHEIPCILATPFERGWKPYLEWVEAEVNGGGD